MKKKYILGIDTSNYTTSVSLLGENGELIANLKRLLPISEGERGLRQSDALFAHTKSLPALLDEASVLAKDGEIAAIGVSTKPRNREGSYMPCFLAGVSAAHAAALGSGAPIYEFSHQCGHIMAALYSGKREIPERFGAFHISGGTTELVLAERADNGFICESVGGTKDLNAGQVIDRLGVLMGFPFPAGKYMEAEALTCTSRLPKRKPTVKATEVNLSGLENIAAKLYAECNDRAVVSAFIFNYIADAVILMCDAFLEKYGDMPLVFAGGVMSNTIIKEKLGKRFDGVFAEPELSRDNAVGIAVLAKNKWQIVNVK